MKKDNSKGFSLLEVMIAAALIAGLGLVIAQLGQNANKVIKTADTRLDRARYIRFIETMLSNNAACSATLEATNLTSAQLTNFDSDNGGNLSADGQDLPSNAIMKQDGTPLFSKNAALLSGLNLQITEIEAGYMQGYPGATELEKFVIKVVFEKTQDPNNPKSYGGQTFIEVFPITIVNNPPSNTFNTADGDSCFYTLNSLDEFDEFDALSTICNGDWAFLDVSGTEPVCTIGPVPQSQRGATFNCPGGQFIRGYNGDGSFNCGNLLAANQTCNDWEFVKGLNADGSPICAPIPKSCGPGETLSHFDTITGQPICLNIGDLIKDSSYNETGKLCADGEVLIMVSGSFICMKSTCPVGQVLRGFQVDGSGPICVPTLQALCSDLGIGSGNQIWPGQNCP